MLYGLPPVLGVTCAYHTLNIYFIIQGKLVFTNQTIFSMEKTGTSCMISNKNVPHIIFVKWKPTRYVRHNRRVHLTSCNG